MMHGLNWYDYSARFKDDFRFITVDPLAEKYYNISPYAYVMNNPLKYIDPTGRQVIPTPYGPVPVPVAPVAGSTAVSSSKYTTLDQRAAQGRTYIEAAKTIANFTRTAQIAIGIVTLHTIISDVKEFINPGYIHQEKQGKKAKEALDAAQVAVGKAIIDNISGDMPSGDPAPKRDPKGTIGKIVLGTGATAAAIKETVEYISNASKDSSNERKDDNKPVQNNPPKENNSQQTIDWNKVFNPIDFSK